MEISDWEKHTLLADMALQEHDHLRSANFWRVMGDVKYELKYLKLASEKVLTLVPQCPNSDCDAVAFMKRHPNPNIARLVQNIDSATNCNLIAKFRLH